MSTSDNLDQPEKHRLDSDRYSKSKDLPAGTDVNALLIDWFKTHARFLQKTSQLVLADARLAAASGLQLAALAVAFSIVFVCTWMVFNVGIALFLMWVGLSLPMSVLIVFMLHLAMLVALTLAIRSTYQGLRFSASKKTLFTKPDQFQGKTHAKDTHNE